MSDQERYEEMVRDLLREHPEAELETVEGVIEVLGALGIEEPDPELVEVAVVELGALLVGDYDALVREAVTDEEMEQMMREEFARLMDPETKLVRSDELDQAVMERMKARVKALFPRSEFFGSEGRGDEGE